MSVTINRFSKEVARNRSTVTPNLLRAVIAVLALAVVAVWAIPPACAQQVITLKGHTPRVNCVAFSPDGNTLASGGRRGMIKMWDVARGTLKKTLEGSKYPLNFMVFSPDGKTLASGSEDETIKLWDVARGALKRTFKRRYHFVESVAFSPDGNTLACGDNESTISLWGVARGTLKRTLEGHRDDVTSVAFSPHGKTLASGSGDDTIKLWDVASGKLIRTLKGHTFGVKCVAFSPDGKTLASGGGDHTIKLWDPTAKEQSFFGGARAKRTLQADWVVKSVAFSPDGKTLAAAVSQTLTLWDVASGTLKRTLEGHSGSVNSVAFSPDGKTLASGSDDGTIKLWPLVAGERQPAEQADQQKIQATWRVVSVRRDGKPMTVPAGDTYTFGPVTFTIKTADNPPAQLKYKIDPTTRPKELDVTLEADGRTEVSKMIYSLEGDTLTICYPAPGQARPTELATRAGDGRTLVVLKRQQEASSNTSEADRHTVSSADRSSRLRSSPGPSGGFGVGDYGGGGGASLTNQIWQAEMEARARAYRQSAAELRARAIQQAQVEAARAMRNFRSQHNPHLPPGIW